MFVQMLAKIDGDYESYHLAPEKLIAGNPKQEVWMQYSDASQSYFVGTWASERGKWKVAYTEEEYCEILEGRSVISDLSGNAVTVSPGDRFVVPRGFAGTWEVVERTRKVFVIHQPAA